MVRVSSPAWSLQNEHLPAWAEGIRAAVSETVSLGMRVELEEFVPVPSNS